MQHVITSVTGLTQILPHFLSKTVEECLKQPPRAEGSAAAKNLAQRDRFLGGGSVDIRTGIVGPRQTGLHVMLHLPLDQAMHRKSRRGGAPNSTRALCRPFGTRLRPSPTRHSRAALQVVPSPRDCFVAAVAIPSTW
jgi:hypothetical protein